MVGGSKDGREILLSCSVTLTSQPRKCVIYFKYKWTKAREEWLTEKEIYIYKDMKRFVK